MAAAYTVVRRCLLGMSEQLLEPLDIRLSADTESLEIEWSDGHVTSTRVHTLRWKCPCAECSGEMGYRGRLASVSELPADEYVLTGIAPVGRYALAPVWGSGHDKGLFTYDLLRYLCECQEHTAAREAVGNRPTGALVWRNPERR